MTARGILREKLSERNVSLPGGLCCFAPAGGGRVELISDANTGWLVRGRRAGKLWMTAVIRNQAESIITGGLLPRDSMNRQREFNGKLVASWRCRRSLVLVR